MIGSVSPGGKAMRLKWMNAGAVAGCRRLGLASPIPVRLVGRLRLGEGLVGVGIVEVVEDIVLRSSKAETYSAMLTAAAAVEAASRVDTDVCRRSAGHLACMPGIVGVEVVKRLAVVG